MRNLIKSLITLAFVAGAFWIGKYTGEEKYSAQIKEMNSKTEAENRQVLKLQDSINILKAMLKKEEVPKAVEPMKSSQRVTKQE